MQHTLVLLDGDPFPDQTIRARMLQTSGRSLPLPYRLFLLIHTRLV
ncbi:MAG TPA: hypothetical protein VFN35_20025 [Ktedonobacteraceae bacterium]|nr:hypothetical protein [Ktedonobacteraceae bacterium]